MNNLNLFNKTFLKNSPNILKIFWQTYCAKKTSQFEKHDNLTKLTIPVFKKAFEYSDKIALKDQHGYCNYSSLLVAAKSIADEISECLNGKTGERIAFLCPNDGSFVMVLWGIWISGQIAVPLSEHHPKEMLKYYVNDCESKLLITTNSYSKIFDEIANELDKQVLVISDDVRKSGESNEKIKISESLNKIGQDNEFYEKNDALILYTSGTTGNPKGVVSTFKNIEAMILSMIEAWKWSPKDCILHTLPLNHMHGLVNVLLCSHYVGAKCIMLPKFDSTQVWEQLIGINIKAEDRVNIYMAVPTIYSKLIQDFEKLFKPNQKMTEYIYETLKTRFKFMMSGSAPLPLPVFNQWLDISGQRLLERYGMSEIGMCLSNLYDYKIEILSSRKKITPKFREPTYVGLPLPGVEIQLAEQIKSKDEIFYRPILESSNKNQKIEIKLKNLNLTDDNLIGELFVKGDNVFKCYYNKENETKKEFTSDGWFKTGDIAQYDPKNGLFKLLGRSSVDIIKSGGYKISALFIETVLLSHPNIKEIAVVALPDVTWGEKIAAIIVVDSDDSEITQLSELRKWAKDKLPSYCLPSVIKVIETIPRNAMGKVNKKELIKLVFSEMLSKN